MYRSIRSVAEAPCVLGLCYCLQGVPKVLLRFSCLHAKVIPAKHRLVIAAVLILKSASFLHGAPVCQRGCR